MKKTVLLLLIAGVYTITAAESHNKDAKRVKRNWDKGDTGNMFRGTAGVDYPDLREIPNTNFRCSEQQFEGGMYADVEAQCQVYHVCHEGRKNSFLCGKGTIFNQQILACDYWYSTECDTAPSFYYVNAEIGKQNGNYQPPAEHDIRRIHNPNKGDQGRNFQPSAGSSLTGGNRQRESQPAVLSDYGHGNRQQSFQPARGSNRQPGQPSGGSNYGHGNRQPNVQPSGGSDQQPGFQPAGGSNYGQGNEQPGFQPSGGSDHARGDSNDGYGDHAEDFQPSGGNVGQGFQPSHKRQEKDFQTSDGNQGRGFQPSGGGHGNQDQGFQPSDGGHGNQDQGFQTAGGSRGSFDSQNQENNPNFQPTGHSNRGYRNQGVGSQRPGSSNQGHRNRDQSQPPDNQSELPEAPHDPNCYCMKAGYQTQWSFPKFPVKVK